MKNVYENTLDYEMLIWINNANIIKIIMSFEHLKMISVRHVLRILKILFVK